jgi:hypothetical protein
VKRNRINFLDKLAIRIFCMFNRKTRRLVHLLDKIRDESSELNLNEIELALVDSRALFLNKSSITRNTVSLKEEITIYYRILQIPGLLRWLLNYLQIPATKSFYQLSRYKVLRICVKHFSSLRKRILSTVSISSDNAANYEIIRSSIFINPYSDLYIDEAKTYLVDFIHSSNRIKKSNNLINANILSRIFVWKSSYAQIILKSVESSQKLSSYSSIKETHPNFARIYFKNKIIDFIFHPKASLSFDERLSADLPDVIDSIDNVEIINQTFIIKESKWFIIDETCDPKQRFVSGQWLFYNKIRNRNCVSLSIPKTPKTLYFQEAIFLMGRVDENWYHFLLDTLPRYIFLKELSNSIPLLVRKDIPNTTIKFISKITSRMVVQIDQDEIVQVKKLYFLAARSTSFDTKSNVGLPRFQFSPNVIRKLKLFILTQFAKNDENKLQDKHYLIHNSAKRNLLNINNISNFLDNYGFKELKLNDDYLKNQISYFANTNILVAKGGAACANMIFLKPQSHMIILRGLRERKIKIWKLLAESSQVQLSEVFGLSTYFGLKENRAIHSNFIIPVYKLKNMLKNY